MLVMMMWLMGFAVFCEHVCAAARRGAQLQLQLRDAHSCRTGLKMDHARDVVADANAADGKCGDELDRGGEPQ
jgi:hypothetical protein